MAKIWVLQHHPVENLGSIADALEGAALAWQYVRTFEGQPVPKDMKGAGGLIVMGGPQGVYETDQHPFLKDEMRLIESALKENRPVMGVCLGSQLLAAALGAKVYKGAHREIGWHPVKLSAEARNDRLLKGVPEEFTAFHWHGDVFDLPRDSVALASSEITPIQAFRHGDNAYGFLFHLEVTEASVNAMVREFTDEVKHLSLRAAILEGVEDNLEKLTEIGEALFSRWASPIQGT
ncbi:MAG TPA: type 1 glutamine amidotransferase [Candidatus Binataceae bacterium]|nr:type 1 glutamine amidotransferase [Candidatus Binataceae bacterium]